MLYVFKLGRKLCGEEFFYFEKGGKGGLLSSGVKEVVRVIQYVVDL